jgi:hypothetical protein
MAVRKSYARFVLCERSLVSGIGFLLSSIHRSERVEWSRHSLSCLVDEVVKLLLERYKMGHKQFFLVFVYRS